MEKIWTKISNFTEKNVFTQHERITVCIMKDLLSATWKDSLYIAWTIYCLNMKGFTVCTTKIYYIQHKKIYCMQHERFTVCNMKGFTVYNMKGFTVYNMKGFSVCNMKNLLYATWKIYCMQHEKFYILNMKEFTLCNMKDLLPAALKDLL